MHTEVKLLVSVATDLIPIWSLICFFTTGLGQTLAEMCQNNEELCPGFSGKRWCDLTPYEHLNQIFRVCGVHFKRGILKLGDAVPRPVRSAMYSLATTQRFTSLAAVFTFIRTGGPKSISKSICYHSNKNWRCCINRMAGRQNIKPIRYSWRSLAREPNSTWNMASKSFYNEWERTGPSQHL